MIIDIIGAGSLGLLYGSKLQAAGHQVRYWTRTSEQASNMKRLGLQITEPNEAEALSISGADIQAHCIKKLAETWAHSPGSWLLLMVKQTAMDDIIHDIKSISKEPLNIICFQNGIGHVAKLQKAMQRATIHSAITTEGAKRVGNEVIRAGEGQTWIGLSEEASPRHIGHAGENGLISLVHTIQQAGFDCTVSNQIDKLIYRKLIINAVINPLTAVWRVPNGELLLNKERTTIMRQLYDEAITIYRASGITADADLWEQLLNVCQTTASNTSSMLADVLEGRRTEIDSINGQVVNLAHQCGLTAPLHETLLHLIKAMHPEGVN
ncbi:ketopantoate reductase family protein [Paenibacillus sp. ACRSA]|uniref:ketopantoate reductase family protein n=1 Tax=Paenibacillus sp. ACRSA TaxID=2918211 RepID=UPI001EF64065|nr:ketopantoate reductase family protein [Paenibacillus sp. ACRSA]MCG7375929.1 ketopantoate reductase family protein [Paenibacillus sp. ACRSA]